MEKAATSFSTTVRKLSETKREPLPEKYTDRIFLRLSAIYGHKFDSLFKTEESVLIAKAEWSDALAGFSAYQISKGLSRCKRIKDWNPNIPEFIALALSIPNLAVATERALTGECIDPVSLAICQRLGYYELRNRTTQELEKRIRGIYPDVCEEVIEKLIGLEHEWKPPLQIEQKPEPEKPVTKSVGIEALENIREIMS